VSQSRAHPATNLNQPNSCQHQDVGGSAAGQALHITALPYRPAPPRPAAAQSSFTPSMPPHRSLHAWRHRARCYSKEARRVSLYISSSRSCSLVETPCAVDARGTPYGEQNQSDSATILHKGGVGALYGVRYCAPSEEAAWRGSEACEQGG